MKYLNKWTCQLHFVVCGLGISKQLVVIVKIVYKTVLLIYTLWQSYLWNLVTSLWDIDVILKLCSLRNSKANNYFGFYNFKSNLLLNWIYRAQQVVGLKCQHIQEDMLLLLIITHTFSLTHTYTHSQIVGGGIFSYLLPCSLQFICFSLSSVPIYLIEWYSPILIEPG
jgi:hypothetical protein